MEIVKFKMPANVKYELTGLGMIKACTILDELYKYDFVTKKIDNVILRLENLLVYGKEISKGEYDALTNEVILYLRDEPKFLDENDEFYTTCEWCGGKLYENFICSECGFETETK